jgi:xanthosine utilization system XapX-like protein
VTAKLLPAAIGFLLFAMFIGFLAIRIAAPPMLIIVGFVLVLCTIDFVQTLREE